LVIFGVIGRRPTVTPTFFLKIVSPQRVTAVLPGVQVGRRFTPRGKADMLMERLCDCAGEI